MVTFSPSATAHSIEEGSNYAVQCLCGQCEPSCSVTWTLDNVEVVGAQLNFSDTARHAAGNYICTCVNSGTSTRATETFTLTVLCKYHLLSCQPRVTVMTYFVYKAIRDLESIDHLCINPIRRIGLIHKVTYRFTLVQVECTG